MNRPDPRQFDLFAAPAPEPVAVAIAAGRAPRERTSVKTRAHQHDGMITLYGDGAPVPFEVVVRGVPCVIAYSGGFCTHAVDGPGSLFWSETGFRSFGQTLTDPAAIVAAIERYIDAPAKDGSGCGGKLKRWWPSYVLHWQQSLGFELSHGDRATMWGQWGPERHAEAWAKHDTRLAAQLARMRAEGIDPDDVGPPAHFRGTWPHFAQEGLL